MESLGLSGVYTKLRFAIDELQKIVDQQPSSLDMTRSFVSHFPSGNVVAESSFVGASSLPSSSAHGIVGLANDLIQMKDRLTGHGTNLEVIPIVGMGGIGKTTLAQQLYQDSLVSYHFNILTWASVSQEYNLRAILFSLLDCKTADEILGKEDDQLAELMYKKLFGRRYLVVLDDVWSPSVWDTICRFFPENNRWKLYHLNH